MSYNFEDVLRSVSMVAMGAARVPIRELVHHSREVLQRVESGERVEITRRGRVVAVMTAPDPDEVTMDELVATNQVRPGWRERQARLRQTLNELPARAAPPGPPASTAALLTDRYDER